MGLANNGYISENEMNWLFLVSQMVPYHREQDNLLSPECRNWYRKNYLDDPEAVAKKWAEIEAKKAKAADNG